MKKITGCSVAIDGLEMAFKSPAIMVHVEPNIIAPIVYFRKPRYISEEQFKVVVEDITSQFKGLSQHTIAVLEDK